MNKYILFRILQVTVGLVLIGVFIFYLLDINIFSKVGFFKIPTLISTIVLFWGFYFSIGWKWPYLRKLAYKINLNGTWVGTYNSTDFTSNTKYNGKIVLVIRQTFISLNIKSYTDKYVNYSFGEALNYEAKSDSHQLIYLYSQNFYKQADENIRKGTSELQLLINPKKKYELFGLFWTNHNSKGFLNFTKKSKKHAKSFNEAYQLKK